jgi:hypothetical protein
MSGGSCSAPKEKNMTNRPKKTIVAGVAVSSASSADLKGKQSVRTTFRLSERTINVVSIVASHLGIRQKSLFDHLMEDMAMLKTIADQVQDSGPLHKQRIQKTYVISRRSLAYLEQIAREHHASRDALVEFSVQRLLPLIKQEQEMLVKRRAVRKEYARYVAEGKKLLNKAEKFLGHDDPVTEELESGVAATESALQKIDSFIEKGKVIEQF